MIVHISPTYFSENSVIGGAERYVDALTRAQSRSTPIRWITFGDKPHREMLGVQLERVVLANFSKNRFSPVSPFLISAMKGASVVHCHQYYTLSTSLAILAAFFMRVPCFVTDLGGGGWTPAFYFDQSRFIHSHLPISHYAATKITGKNKRVAIIGAGVDHLAFSKLPRVDHDGAVVYLGRMLPHKGIHDLIEALPAGTILKLIGPPGPPDYLSHLRRLAGGKCVQFLHGLSDSEVERHLKKAMTLVHPTPTDVSGDAGANELFGLAVAEAMSLGTVPIVTSAASLPELVAHQHEGLIVSPNAPSEIAAAIRSLQNSPSLWRDYSLNAKKRAHDEFTWAKVAQRCFSAYNQTA